MTFYIIINYVITFKENYNKTTKCLKMKLIPELKI